MMLTCKLNLTNVGATIEPILQFPLREQFSNLQFALDVMSSDDTDDWCGQEGGVFGSMVREGEAGGLGEG